MKIKDLYKYIAENNIPEDAEIIIEADYGQNEEFASTCVVSRSPVAYDTGSMIFEFSGYEYIYDPDAIEAYHKDGDITAILITSLGVGMV